ncbi:hypothetical protein [Halorubrum kocurii]|uniref:DUF5658 domain-containing protein n=1 Tax=Halorubrum kocurii JCM 14978 TaxID=1230456 RepID=M0PMR5_9EURY|nr:hypothetical protein [Halorubrum kocurii]EMA70025.1 hypothetical protein C468_00780 [Halorubrum kocurii JCM 14978]
MTDIDDRLIPNWSPQALWTLAVAFFVVGDLLTTSIGVSSGQIAEVGPLGEPIVSRYGIPGMVALKLVVVGCSRLAWRLAPTPDRIGIPLGLVVVGILVTFWNFFVVLSASGSV